MCAAARRIVGFKPIESRMLDIQIHCYVADSMEEAKLQEIKSYLKCEMKLKTRIRVGRYDIELSTREAGSTPWKKQVLPGSLPTFEMIELRPDMTSSPPPGRPGRDLGVIENGEGLVDEVGEDNVAREEATAN